MSISNLFEFVCLVSITDAFSSLTFFKSSTLDQNTWPLYIYSSVQFSVNSRLECSQICAVQQSSICDLIVHMDDTCYLGKNNPNQTFLPVPQTSEATIFISENSLDFTLDKTIAIDNIPEEFDSWTRHIVEAESSIPNMDKCVKKCAKQVFCDLVSFEGTKCHFGNSSKFDGQSVRETSGPVNVRTFPGTHWVLHVILKYFISSSTNLRCCSLLGLPFGKY